MFNRHLVKFLVGGRIWPVNSVTSLPLFRGFGWGGWTRTNTVLINSEVPYRLDHAPTRLK